MSDRARALRHSPQGQGFTPTPRTSAYVLNVTSGFFRFLAHLLTTFGRWGCGERYHLSHVVGDSVAVLFENAFCKPSRAPERDFLVPIMVWYVLALKTRSEAPRRTKRGLNARQGMGGAKNAYRGFQEVRRADTPN